MNKRRTAEELELLEMLTAQIDNADLWLALLDLVPERQPTPEDEARAAALLQAARAIAMAPKVVGHA